MLIQFFLIKIKDIYNDYNKLIIKGIKNRIIIVCIYINNETIFKNHYTSCFLR